MSKKKTPSFLLIVEGSTRFRHPRGRTLSVAPSFQWYPQCGRSITGTWNDLVKVNSYQYQASINMRNIRYPPKKNNMSPWKGTILKGNSIFQPSIFKGYVSFQGGHHLTSKSQRPHILSYVLDPQINDVPRLPAHLGKWFCGTDASATKIMIKIQIRKLIKKQLSFRDKQKKMLKKCTFGESGTRIPPFFQIIQNLPLWRANQLGSPHRLCPWPAIFLQGMYTRAQAEGKAYFGNKITCDIGGLLIWDSNL